MFEYHKIGSSYTILKYNGDEQIVNIPDTYLGRPVIEIDRLAFHSNMSIRHVRMGESMLKIGDYAFANSWVQIISFSTQLQEIGLGSFQSCLMLRDLTIPKRVKTIGRYAFHGCHKLGVVRIEGRPKIGLNAFDECFDMKFVHV